MEALPPHRAQPSKPGWPQLSQAGEGAGGGDLQLSAGDGRNGGCIPTEARGSTAPQYFSHEDPGLPYTLQKPERGSTGADGNPGHCYHTRTPVAGDKPRERWATRLSLELQEAETGS